MTINGKAYIVGAYEHPTRHAPDKSVAQLHAECAKGALEDAGLSLGDIDGYFCAGDAPGLGVLNIVDYLNLRVRHVDSTETGGSSYLAHVSHAAQAIAAGKCNVALITMAGRPRSEGQQSRVLNRDQPDVSFELPFTPLTLNLYAMVAMRHMYEYGATAEQLAWIKVAASHHAQHNPNAMLRDVLTENDVLESPMISDPLHWLDCCVVSDGGGALIVARPEIAAKLHRPKVKILGAGEHVKGQLGGEVDLSWSGAMISGSAAFAEAGVVPAESRKDR
jgi:acetyl-CoA C-acetyltransferase